MMRMMGLAGLALLATAACAEAEGQRAPGQAERPVAEAEPLRAWLTSRAWRLEEETCDSGDPVIYGLDGRYASVNYGGGSWTLTGDQIRFDSDTGEPRAWTLSRIDDNTAEFSDGQGLSYRMIGCPLP